MRQFEDRQKSDDFDHFETSEMAIFDHFGPSEMTIFDHFGPLNRDKMGSDRDRFRTRRPRIKKTPVRLPGIPISHTGSGSGSGSGVTVCGAAVRCGAICSACCCDWVSPMPSRITPRSSPSLPIRFRVFSIFASLTPSLSTRRPGSAGTCG